MDFGSVFSFSGSFTLAGVSVGANHFVSKSFSDFESSHTVRFFKDKYKNYSDEYIKLSSYENYLFSSMRESFKQYEDCWQDRVEAKHNRKDRVFCSPLRKRFRKSFKNYRSYAKNYLRKIENLKEESDLFSLLLTSSSIDLDRIPLIVNWF